MTPMTTALLPSFTLALLIAACLSRRDDPRATRLAARPSSLRYLISSLLQDSDFFLFSSLHTTQPFETGGSHQEICLSSTTSSSITRGRLPPFLQITITIAIITSSSILSSSDQKRHFVILGLDASRFAGHASFLLQTFPGFPQPPLSLLPTQAHLTFLALH